MRADSTEGEKGEKGREREQGREVEMVVSNRMPKTKGKKKNDLSAAPLPALSLSHTCRQR